MDQTPVIIGVGEASERIGEPGYEALSPADLAGRAALAALADAGAASPLAKEVDVIAAIRQFETSGPRAIAPFGRADNFPRAVARRIGADPARAVLEPVGGQGPQHLVNEFAHAIADGAAKMVLLTGAEAVSTVRALTARSETRDWSETLPGSLEDRGYGERMVTRDLVAHGARAPMAFYALFENARRARLRLGRAAYRREMARLFAPFTVVAAGNPHAMSRDVLSVEDIETVTAQNRLTADPFPRRVVSRDQTNQGASVLLTSVGRAQALGVPRNRMIFLHGGADVRERTPMERQDLSASPAAIAAAKHALEVAGRTVGGINLIDFYSCFPIAVFNIRDGLGIGADDPRSLTLTGGLPFFGGAGNNYSMHAIASMVRALRLRLDAFGLITANGGMLSKYSVGVYSATPAPWSGFSSAALQAEIDAWPAPLIAAGAAAGMVETYTIDHSGPSPFATVVGRRDGDHARFVARTDPDDPAIAVRMMEEEPLGARITVSPGSEERDFVRSFEPEQ